MPPTSNVTAMPAPPPTSSSTSAAAGPPPDTDRRHAEQAAAAPLDPSAGTASEDRISRLERAARNAVPLVGVIGAALYAVLRVAYLAFYLRLRTTPEEVGYGYSQI